MDNDATAAMQAILTKLNRLGSQVQAQAQALDTLTATIEDATARMEEAVDRALATQDVLDGMRTTSDDIPF